MCNRNEDAQGNIRCSHCEKVVDPMHNFECLNKIGGHYCKNPMCHTCSKNNDGLCPACKTAVQNY